MANKGSARAVVSCWLLDQYIKQNPHSPTDVGPPPPAVVTSLPPDTPHQ
jgi:hypothetical protein